MSKGFAFPKQFKGKAEDLEAVIADNDRALVRFLNNYTATFDDDSSTLSLPGDLQVTLGDIILAAGGKIDGIDPSAHAHTITDGSAQVDHGNLGGLGDEADHPDFLTLDGSRAMTGDFDMNNQSILNLRALQTGGANLTNDSASAFNTFEDWGTQVVAFPNPNATVDITATLNGWVDQTGGGSALVRIRLSVSIDGGVNWASSINTIHNTPSERSSITNTLYYVNRNPTGDVWIKGQLYQQSGTLGTPTFRDGTITAVMTPA